MSQVELTTVRSGINRLRVRGGARPDTLYDLLNGYATEAGTVKVRPGTERIATLDPLTRGLCAFNGELHTFCHTVVAVPAGFTLNVLTHPDPPSAEYGYPGYGLYEDGVPIKTIHFSEPFLGGLYVAAEFEEGSVYHYWLRPGIAWAADTQYDLGDHVVPSTPNGFVYRAFRYGDPNPVWQPEEPRADGQSYEEQSVVEPTTYNGFYYVCIEVIGDNPRSGTVEPTWPTFDGGTVFERTDTGQPSSATIDSLPVPPAGGPPATPDPPPTTPTDPDWYPDDDGNPRTALP
jgi:hypothetical protein